MAAFVDLSKLPGDSEATWAKAIELMGKYMPAKTKSGLRSSFRSQLKNLSTEAFNSLVTEFTCENSAIYAFMLDQWQKSIKSKKASRKLQDEDQSDSASEDSEAMKREWMKFQKMRAKERRRHSDRY